MSPLYVYVAGPMRKGDFACNVQQALDVAEQLRFHGHFPFVPHLNHLWDLMKPGTSIEYWMEYDLGWLARCDALVRIPGVSIGADQEVAYASAHGIPTFASVGCLLDWHKAKSAQRVS